MDARGDLGGTARVLPGSHRLSGRPARAQGLDRKVWGQVDGGGQHRVQRALRAGDVGPQQGHGPQKEQALLQCQGHHPRQGDHPDHSRGLGGAAVREQRDRPDLAPDGRPQAAPGQSPYRQGGLPVSIPRYLVSVAASNQAPLRQHQSAAGGRPRRSTARTWCAFRRDSRFPPMP